eukprot:gnl/Chilomastix_cuspidata/2572.p1 GENE.gnl/Chilomastix_cuspidata/2572~~gnl/Chilomastix_cuspidata/2572.p1  ORF type:complete len:147 (-),score=29.46 gnl/Chilomastix_cuspidata/2572:69-509(-)
MSFSFYVLVFNVPVDALADVKAALFAAGAGEIAGYSHASFETPGVQQFKPLPGSNPTIGEHGRVESVNEVRVEMAVKTGRIVEVVAALQQTHPYEVPAFHFYPALLAKDIAAPRSGKLSAAVTVGFVALLLGALFFTSTRLTCAHE